MCHQVLADVYPNALPDWDAGLLNKAPDIDDDMNGQPARLKVQKKRHGEPSAHSRTSTSASASC